MLAIIPARGGSKGIPGKNIVPVAGRPLLSWTILAAHGSQSLDRIVVSTDSEEIADVARRDGAEVIMRPECLAEDDTPTLQALQHAVQALSDLDGYAPEAVMTLQPTSPLRTTEDIDAAAALFSRDPTADSLVSVITVPHIFHPLSVMKQDEGGYLIPFVTGTQTPTRRQDKTPVLARNGAAIYITRTTCLNSFVFGGRLLPFPMPEERSLDIDTMADLEIAERVLNRQQASV